MYATAQPVSPAATSARLVSIDGRPLPLHAVSLSADACAGFARVILSQTFINPHAEPLEVTYQVPLPADGAVSGYAFTFGDTRIVGEIDRKQRARARYEEALLTGRGAALLEQDRSSLFTQKVGNIPAGATVRCELTIDQPLIWRAGSWEWRFPTVVAPRYQGAPGAVADAARQTVHVADGPVGTPCTLTLNIRDAITGPARSPSHAITSAPQAITLAGAAQLDRDVVIRWPVSVQDASLTLDTGRPAQAEAAYAALTVVPPRLPAHELPAAISRDLIVLIDTSGSMHGEPLNQAKQVITALLNGLRATDQMELIEFSWRPSRWKRKAVFATPKNKKKAIDWLNALSAGGGTEMRDGILAALDALRSDAQRQVLLVTDGLIGAETTIIETICNRLPQNARVHSLGIGTGVNRTLTGGAARAGGGIELICAPGEDVTPMVAQLLARTEAPLVVDLTLSGSALREAAPARLPDLFAGAPARLALALNPQGGTLQLEGRTAAGPWRQTLQVPPMLAGTGNPALAPRFGREKVEDLETRIAAGERSLDPQIEALGLQFGIATRLTSWIATSQHALVDPTEATRSETMPHQLPHGMSAEGLGLRRPMPAGPSGVLRSQMSTGAPPPAPAPRLPSPARAGSMATPKRERSKGMFGWQAHKAAPPPPMAPGASADFDDAEFDDEAPAELEALEELSLDAFAAPEPIVLADAEGAAQRTVHGTIKRVGEHLVITFSAGGHRWQVPRTVTLTLADGRTLQLQVEPTLTTSAGPLAAGTQARLALRHPGPITRADVLRVEVSDALVITL
jgi:Ca-activated chloride channel family protein